DIRNGTQLECVNCTACIDECNHIMRSVNLPEGLIRYASETEISENKKFRFTPRMKHYTVVVVNLSTVLIGLLILRIDVEATIPRLPGQLFDHKGENISNVYSYKLVNKAVKDFDDAHFKLVEPKGTIKVVGKRGIFIPRED